MKHEERSLRGLVWYSPKLGGSGFGGPIGLVGYMRRDLVEERGWFSEAEFGQGLAVGQTMPGPLAAQVAMWFGYLHAGARGAFAVALPFIVPPFLIVTAVAALYAHYDGLKIVQALFLGIGPAVMAIIAISAYKIARSTNKRDPVLWGIALLLAVVTAAAGAEHLRLREAPSRLRGGERRHRARPRRASRLQAAQAQEEEVRTR